MKITALRAIAKINNNVFRNSRRMYSFKFEMTPANRLAAEPSAEESKPSAPEEAQKPASATTNFRYNVCQPRTSPVERPNMAGDMVAVQKQSVKAAIEQQHLQPAMLPEYFQKQMEKNALINPEPEPSEEDRINKGHNPGSQRRFQASKTYANAVLPLKSVKLANPFPEPVKMMMSRTVSDDEKAEQMLAESRSQRNHSGWSNKSTASHFRNFATDVKRWYSSKSVGKDNEKCPKLGQAKKGCPALKVPNCPPRARLRCDRLARNIDCKKQEAPYPAYSEFCHEDIEEKPSECKLCPWKTDENPNFKPQKKSLHTSGTNNVRRSGLEMDWTDYQTEETNATAAEEEETAEGMQCDLRKPACERPKNRRCPPTKEEIKKKEEAKKKKPPKKCIAQLMSGGVLPAEAAQDILSLKEQGGKPKPKEHGPCKIKRFKFPKCGKIKRGESWEGKCPPKKKGPRIHDCPPEDKRCDAVDQIVDLNLKSGQLREMNLKGDQVKKDKRKCPHIDMTVQRNEDDDDPCRLKKKGVTKICPGDLLKKKKRKPRKKTSGIDITPVDSKTDMPQPTRTI